jgi:hypothetical protein
MKSKRIPFEALLESAGRNEGNKLVIKNITNIKDAVDRAFIEDAIKE